MDDDTYLPNDHKVRAWMSPPEHRIAPDGFVEEALTQMRRADIRHLLVMNDEDELTGVVTDRDLRRPEWLNGDVLSVREMYLLGDELRVYDVMSANKVVTAHPDDSTSYAARMMVENKFNCLPVVDDDEKVVGIITSTDLLAALVHELEPEELEEHAVA